MIEGIPVDDEAARQEVMLQAFEWFGQDPKGANPLMHITKEHVQNRPVPYCRKEPFAMWPKVIGFGITELQACDRKVCPSCKQKALMEDGLDLRNLE